MPYNQRMRGALDSRTAGIEAEGDFGDEPAQRGWGHVRAPRQRGTADTGLPGSGRSGLPPALDADVFFLQGINCYLAGSGAPLLLVHDVDATASAAELRPVVEHYRAKRTVFAPDLPGFGLSERGERPYSPRLMTDAVQAVGTQIGLRCAGAPIDALAVGLGCEFLARAAAEAPQRYARLAFVDPTGLRSGRPLRAAPGSTRTVPALRAMIRSSAWSDALFRAWTRPSAVRHRLERRWGSRAIDEALCDYDLHSARQPGARFAPMHYLAGSLSSADIHTVYERLPQPVWVCLGLPGTHVDLDGLAQVRRHWRLSLLHSGAVPFLGQANAFFDEFDAFLLATVAASAR